MGKKKAKKLKQWQAMMTNEINPVDPKAGLFKTLKQSWGQRQTEQFILGAVVGAAAVYILGDEQTRHKVIKAGMTLYTNLMGEFEEIKEQMADIQAEIQAEMPQQVHPDLS